MTRNQYGYLCCLREEEGVGLFILCNGRRWEYDLLRTRERTVRMIASEVIPNAGNR